MMITKKKNDNIILLLLGAIIFPICVSLIIFIILMSGFLFPKGFGKIYDWIPFLLINIPSITVLILLTYIVYKCVNKNIFCKYNFSFLSKILIILLTEFWPTVFFIILFTFFIDP